MPKNIQRKKVFVGLSGGVDSAVSAALLKEAGHEVTGVFIETWHPDFLPCTWREDRREAMRVAAHLEIPFISLNLSEEYRKDVGEYFISEYARGRTPNPDVLCNRSVKFGGFTDFARKKGADAVATGHYAQILQGAETLEMHKGKDADKDQSYFLWMLREEEFDRIMFPIGSYTKPEVRKLAEQFKLPNARRKDSQGICFLGAVDLHDFLGRYIPLKDGTLLNMDNKVIGSHRGASLYTIGERHGFTALHTTAHEEPLYVVRADIQANTVQVGHLADIPKYSTFTLTHATFASDSREGTFAAKIRYRGELFPCTVEQVGDRARVTFAEPISIALGQSIVFYQGSRLVGGGVANAQH